MHLQYAERGAGTGTRAAAVLAVILATLSLHARAEPAKQPKIVLSPKQVGPGDILIVTVSGAAGPVAGTFNGKKVYFNEAGSSHRAVVGIDLHLEPGSYPLAVAAAGAAITRTVHISKKKYPVQRLTLPEDLVTLSPENEARVDREQKTMAALWPFESERIWSGSFIDPLPDREVGTPFGVRRIINGTAKNPHSGVDISADEGEPVLAPNDGVAVLVNDQFFSGNSLVLDHGQGIYSMFFHLSKIEVKPGQAVLKREVIARVGSTGRSTGAHLHWGVRIQGAKVDPLALIKLKLE